MNPRPSRRGAAIRWLPWGFAALLLAAGVWAIYRRIPAPGPSGAATAGRSRGVALRLVVSGLRFPVDLAAPAGDSRLFVVEKSGKIRIIAGGRVAATFLDLSARLPRPLANEQGVLGQAFHPRYRATGRYFVHYSDRNGDTTISEFRVSSDPDRIDPASERVILQVRQPYDNHNGGQLAFGPDGYLYIGLGDGGSAGDPHGNSQDRRTLLGSILRIDVDRGSPYSIPRDNPFAGRPGMRGEIWCYGLRNPWRFSFDPATGDLYIGDVGQDRWEEINVAVASRKGGQNFGWNFMEGNAPFRTDVATPSGLTPPVAVYSIEDRPECSVVGGYVYRGRSLPELDGTYFHADHCSGMIRSFRLLAGRAVAARDWTAILSRKSGIGQISTFGVDAAGDLYVLDYGRGRVYRLERE